MSLISCYDELNIVIQITQQQMDLLLQIQAKVTPETALPKIRSSSPPVPNSWEYAAAGLVNAPRRVPYRANLSASRARTPLLQAIDNLQRELADLEELRDNTNALILRTIQLVNIRLEDNGKAILVFTAVTIVFLPLNFIASFFGMNVSDIRNLDQTQALFWIVAVCVTLAVGSLSMLVAFQGSRMLENFRLWRDNRDEVQHFTNSANGRRLHDASILRFLRRQDDNQFDK